jgi:hypothetical protein
MADLHDLEARYPEAFEGPDGAPARARARPAPRVDAALDAAIARYVAARDAWLRGGGAAEARACRAAHHALARRLHARGRHYVAGDGRWWTYDRGDDTVTVNDGPGPDGATPRRQPRCAPRGRGPRTSGGVHEC